MAELTCSSCSKTYKSLNSLFRHKERCILINPDLDLLMLETENTPYTRRILTSLLGRLSVLENKVEQANRFITREKRKINILDYLNKQEKTRALKSKEGTKTDLTAESRAEPTTFSNMKKLIKIDNKQLNYYLENPPIIGLVKILIDNIDSQVTNNEIKPFRSFTQKRSTIYIREFDETHKKYYWLELIEWTDYERLIFIIQQKLLKMYEIRHNKKMERQEQSGHTTQIGNNTAKKDDHYFENIKKILLTNQHSESTSKYFKQRLYEELRENIEIDYEVIF